MIPDLERLGFTRNEANVYSAMLKLGSTSVQKLANATGLNRITVHSIVEKFLSLQICIQSLEGKRRRISPTDPTRLMLLLKQEEGELKEKQSTLTSIMPSLEDLFRKAKRGLQITTFKGELGYEEMCSDILTTKTEMLEYANIDALNAVIGPYIASDYLPTKHQRNIRTKFLFIDSPSSQKYIQENYISNNDAAPMSAKFVNPEEFHMDSFFVIYDGKFAIFTPSTMDGVIIQDQGIYESLLPFFYFVWNNAGEMVVNDAEKSLLAEERSS